MMGRAEEGMRNKEKKRCDHLLEVTEMGYAMVQLHWPKLPLIGKDKGACGKNMVGDEQKVLTEQGRVTDADQWLRVLGRPKALFVRDA